MQKTASWHHTNNCDTMKTIVTILMLGAVHCAMAQAPALFKITVQQKVGYIDRSGKLAIAPQFLNGHDFADGLAAVRQGGYYGFIDATGQFAIAPQYDFATRFVNGFSVVFKNGKPLFINKKGQTVLPPVYKELTFWSGNKGTITTLSGRQGIMDMATGRLLVDTLYGSIGAFDKGVAVVTKYSGKGRSRQTDKVGVMDTTGKMVVPFGRYHSIKPFSEGYAVVEMGIDGEIDGAIDTKGQLLFKRPWQNNTHIDGDFRNGFAKINLYRYWIPEKNGVTASSDKYYEGFIDAHGKVVLDNEANKYVKAFSCNRAFVENGQGYEMIDTRFNKVGKGRYSDVLNDGFKAGLAIVETQDGWGIVDTLGNFIVKPQYETIDRVGIVDGYFFYAEENSKGDERFGIADINGHVVCGPILQEFDRAGFVNGLIKVVTDDRLGYMDKTGAMVWQQSPDSTEKPMPMNIDYMNRGYCYAYSSPGKDEEGSGGWAVSHNVPQPLAPNHPFDCGGLTVRIDTAQTALFAGRYKGYPLFVANATADTVRFKAQDSRLYLKLQALTAAGQWKDIEYLPSSWCGNSYHELALEPNAYWHFTVPRYGGGINTLVRAELLYIDPNNPKANRVVYSNSISAGINPAQFWNKMTYRPSGIMDPYYD
jgi:hypothetical protein